MERAPSLVLFANEGSGGGLGGVLIERARAMSDVLVIPLGSHVPGDREGRVEWLQRSGFDMHGNMRVVVGGGDGSLNWVVSIMRDCLEANDRPPIAVVPLGTGNDMSNFLGWGRGATAAELLPRSLGATLHAARTLDTVRGVDVWGVVVRRVVEGDEGSESEGGARGPVVKEVLVLNYLSVGCDARIARDFQRCRQGSCKCLLCCHCMAKALYGPIGIASLCGVPLLADYVRASVDLSNGECTELAFGRWERTLIFLSISSIYGGRNLWDAGGVQDAGDGQMEVVYQGGAFRLGLVQIGCHTGCCECQCTSARLRAHGPSLWQFDGEPVEFDFAVEVSVRKLDAYPMVFRPRQH